MIDLHPVLSDPARLRQRLIMAEILARRGKGPLALGSYVAARKSPSQAIASLPRNNSAQGGSDG